MSKKDEALKLALEALEQWNTPLYKRKTAITAIREALAEPEEKYRYGTPLLDAMTGNAEQPAQQQEPVGVVGTDIGGTHLMYGTKYVGTTPDKKTAIFFKDVPVGSPLYTSPQPSKPLTDAQIGAVAADIWGSILIAPQSYQAFARAIEAAHGITGETK